MNPRKFFSFRCRLISFRGRESCGNRTTNEAEGELRKQREAIMSVADKQQGSRQIVGISGSIRPGSYTTMAVALALKGAEELK